MCWVIWVIAFALLSPLVSAPIGNPSLPSLLEEGFFIPDTYWSNPQLGFSGDYLIQKKFRPCRQSRPIGLHEAAIRGVSEVAAATWSIRERFNLQVELGSGQFHWRWRQIGRNVTGQSQGGLIWNADAKLIVLEIKDSSLALDGQVGGWDWMEGPASTNGIALRERTKSYLRYWQVGAAVTQKMALFSPYLGIAVNRTRFKVSNLSTGDGKMHARHNLGPFVGCSICNGQRFLVNLEWRGWFEEAVSLSAQIRF